MSAEFPLKEQDMYPLIAEYLRSFQKCGPVFIDGVDKSFVRVKKDMHIREVDVAGLRDPDGKHSQIHLVEAKCLTKGHSFEECFSQVDSVRRSGDRLWTAFPEWQWKSLPQADRQKNEERLNEFDFGLLLVTPEECYAQIKAPPNRQVTESGRTEVLQQLGFAIDPLLPDARGLGRDEAQKAAGVMVLTCMVAEMLYEVETKRVTFHNYWTSPYDGDYATRGWFLPSLELSGPVFCRLDPFGRLLEDGVPSLWVSVELPDEDAPALPQPVSGSWTHVYVEDGEWESKMVPVADYATIGYWKDRGLDQVLELCVRVEISGRMKSSLKSDLERVIKEARRFLSTSSDKTKGSPRKANRSSR